MKKSILRFVTLLFIFSLAVNVNAQRVKGSGNTVNKTRNVGNFQEIAVSGSFDVFLVSGNEGRLDISIEDNLEPYLETEVSNGTLKIKWKKGKSIRTTSKTTITVHFKEISGLSMSGSGDIVGKDKISGKSLGIAVSGSGDINIEMDVENLKSAVSGSGDLKFSGKASDFNAVVSGSGDVDAYDLLAQKAELNVSGSGFIGANVQQEIVARISGSGDIKYKGNPRVEDTKVSGSGSIKMY